MAGTAALTLGLSGFFGALAPAIAAEGAVSGTIFGDVNFNGIQDGEETGLETVTVTAYDASGDEVGSVESDAEGAYSLSYDTGDDSTDVRIEFDVPEGYVPVPVGSAEPGERAGTSVQFASSGDTVHFAATQPESVDPENTDVALAIQRGIQPGSSNMPEAGAATIVSLPYFSAENVAGQEAQHATWEQTGSIWGLDSLDDQYILSSALLKRHAPLGPGGLGAIYVTDTAAGAPNAAELTTIPNVGQNPRGEDDGGEGYDWFHDTVADEVGTTGSGDLEIAEDRASFYVTNLNDRQVYQVPLSAGAGAAPEAGEPTAIPLPLDLPGSDQACGDSNVRPWAVTEQDGQLYVGLTCTGPTAEDLTSYVYTMDVESGQWADSPVAEFPLGGHARGASLYTDGDFLPAVTADAQPWLEETTVPTELVSAQNGDGYAQLALSNIRIDDRGDMVVGMKDRFGDQSGFQAGGTDPSDAELYDGNGAGDVLRLCDAGDGSWEIENNGSCGDLTGDGVDNNRGHGGGEFYDASYKPYHDQAALGALLQMPGTDEVLSSHYDPARDSSAPDAAERVQGWRAYSSENGAASRTVTVTEAAERNDSPGGGFAKAGGLGELSALVAEAPVEIGNRVWLDADGDGVQDSGEAPVEGVTVTLTCGDVTAETTTDANGEYYFNDENVEGGLPASTDCVLTFDATGTDAEGMELTSATAGDNPAIDSDGVAGESGLAEIQATTPAAGADHTFDVGYTDTAAPQLCELGDFVWLDENADGIQDDGEPGVPGVTVTLLDENGDPVVDGNGDPVTTTTDDDGGYLFEGIDCATYQVQFEDPEDRDFTSPEQGEDPATDSNPNPDTGVTPPVDLTEENPSDPSVDAGLIPGEEPAPQVCELG